MEEQTINRPNAFLFARQDLLLARGNAPTLKTVINHHWAHPRQYILHTVHFPQDRPIQGINNAASAHDVHWIFFTRRHRTLGNDVYLRFGRQTEIHIFRKNAYNACDNSAGILHNFSKSS